MAKKDLAREELIRNRARYNNYALTEDVLYLLARIAELEAELAEANAETGRWGIYGVLRRRCEALEAELAAWRRESDGE